MHLRLGAEQPPAESVSAGLLGEQFKVSQISTAVDTDQAGHWEGSFDAPAITKALKAKGYTRGERGGPEIWTHPGDTGASLHVSEDEISYSARDSDPMATVNPQDGASLADNKDFRRAAECLGDVYRADFNPSSSPNPVRPASLGQPASTAAK
ncbi:hypothetical protein [Streptomyces clavifer]|uniref:hypothetical protein n=1 Tax=Streptomyces clavifer TaxID=68188 RepID=UPI0036582FCF